MNHLFKLNKHSSTFCTCVTYIDILKNIEPFFFSIWFSESWVHPEKTVLKQEKKKKWLDLWEISSQTAVSAWDLAIVCHLKELENFKYVFWSGLETHPAGQSLPWCIHPQGQPWPPQGQLRGPLRTSPKWCRGCKVRRGSREEIPLAQGKEQWLRFAGAAVNRYPTSKVRETQVRR